MVPVVIRTEEEDLLHGIAIATKAFEIYETKKAVNIKDSERRVLMDLLNERFPDYKKRPRIDKIKEAIKKKQLGGYDTFNNMTVSYNELKKFLFNK